MLTTIVQFISIPKLANPIKTVKISICHSSASAFCSRSQIKKFITLFGSKMKTVRKIDIQIALYLNIVLGLYLISNNPAIIEQINWKIPINNIANLKLTDKFPKAISHPVNERALLFQIKI